MERSYEQISEIIDSNRAAGRDCFEGLRSSEIGEYNRRIMFGANYEAFPSQEEWSRIVD